MSGPDAGLSETLFMLPADAQLVEIGDLSLRLQAKIGPAPPGHVVVSRPGFRVTTRLVSPELARLMDRFREPRSFVDAVLDFSQAEARDPFATLEDAFDALATLVDGRVLVPADSPDAQAIAPSLAAGQAFGSYEIVALVQALEDSEVYRALAADETPAALKIARPGGKLPFAHEARILERLGGGDSPRLLEVGEVHGRRFLAMEWRPGAPIAAVAQQARASADRRRSHALVAALLAAYGRLHARGVLHGDIHPGNILVADDGRVTLLDFGRARLNSAGGTDISRAGIAHFYEPEMAAALAAGRLPPAVTPRGEQAAVAALAYLLLTGLPTVDATAEQGELLTRIAGRPPLPFTARGIDAWPQVEQVMARAMAKDPAARFADMTAFAEAFAEAPAPRRHRRRPPADGPLGAALERAHQVWLDVDDPEALRLAWLALRAALAWSDPCLLAAADVWAARAGDSWTAWTVRADVARARCDRKDETRALEAFTQRAPPGSAPLSILARLLDGAGAREVEPTPFAAWAADRLYAAIVAGRPALRHHLALARAGVLPLPDGLHAALAGLPAEAGDAELWSLAHDAYAEPSFADRAAQAARRSGDVYDLLRLHQLTGEAGWLAQARRRARTAGSDLAAAIRLVELEAPCRAVRPPFELA